MNILFPEKIRRVIQTLVLCLAMLPVAGCWDRRELNDVLLVVGAGLDRKKDEIELSVQFVLPRATGGGQQSLREGGGGGGGLTGTTLVKSATGVTIADAMARLQKKFSRRIFWGHMKVLVIGEDLARQGIDHYLDFMARHPESRLRTFLFVSRGKARDILDVFQPLESYSAEQARELAKLGVGMKATAKDLLQMLRGEAGAAALPVLKISPAKVGDESDQQPTVTLDGTAIFKKDKLVGIIGDEETRGVLWIRNEIKRAIVTIEPKEADGRVALEMIHFRTELIPEIDNQKWTITVKAVAEDDVAENTTVLNVMDEDVIKLLEKEAEQDLADRIRKALQRVQQEMKVDVLGFAAAFNRKYPKEWEAVKDRWDEVFSSVQAQVQTKVYIRRPGTSSVPPTAPKKEVEKKEQEMKQKKKEGEQK
ncbi:Ger(x)C family spore germination protein [Effusibacillus pohliae]|uniref:Ger(x)C family spore germination protein n=1 Tax=Effusibacillus pohliae TaxID=232270 RepID=UPI00037272E7|nr:Ger(x)C family spore germination protein [Effusibacillus pohliae]